MPLSSIQEEIAAGSLAVLDIDDLDAVTPVTVVTRKNGYLGAAAQTLLAELRLAAASLSASARRGEA